MRIPLTGLFVPLIALSMVERAASSTQEQHTVDQLLERFETTTVFWQQFDVAERIASTRDVRALPRLERWLVEEDRHARGNAAFVFARLGDPRGFETIHSMLTDRSPRPEGQGIPGGRFSLSSQIEADRYYAVHLLGNLKDRRAVEPLIAVLADKEVNYKVAWALGEIGDGRATSPLIAALDDSDALVRVSAVDALVKLGSTEALPKLRELLNDQAMPRAGDRISVAETARVAIAKLQKES